LNFLLIAAILCAAVLGKLIGVGFMSRFYGLRGKSQKVVGISMITRGNDNIATVQIIMAMGIAGFTFSLYTSIIFAMIVTIVITPILLKMFCKD
ncbi:MAG: cation:proton antiporter, partial [Candidatus Aenigmarchaeota archaeon]|nr:cation:proton antiporter [Candidatus Aenigmarchaeota archaeon]